VQAKSTKAAAKAAKGLNLMNKTLTMGGTGRMVQYQSGALRGNQPRFEPQLRLQLGGRSNSNKKRSRRTSPKKADPLAQEQKKDKIVDIKTLQSGQVQTASATHYRDPKGRGFPQPPGRFAANEFDKS
jgi:hypothetical protein